MLILSYLLQSWVKMNIKLCRLKSSRQLFSVLIIALPWHRLQNKLSFWLLNRPEASDGSETNPEVFVNQWVTSESHVMYPNHFSVYLKRLRNRGIKWKWCLNHTNVYTWESLTAGLLLNISSSPSVSPAGRCAILPTTAAACVESDPRGAATEAQNPAQASVSYCAVTPTLCLPPSQKTEVSAPRCMTSPNIPSSNGASPCWCWRSRCCSQSRWRIKSAPLVCF